MRMPTPPFFFYFPHGSIVRLWIVDSSFFRSSLFSLGNFKTVIANVRHINILTWVSQLMFFILSSSDSSPQSLDSRRHLKGRDREDRKKREKKNRNEQNKNSSVSM